MIEKFVVQTVALPSGVIAGEDRDVSSTTMYWIYQQESE